MPIDIQHFRVDQGGNPDLVRESQKKRFADVGLVDTVIEYDTKQREIRGQLDDLNKDSRKISIKFGDINKKVKKEKRKLTEEEQNELSELKNQKILIEAKQNEFTKKYEEYILQRDKALNEIGNLVPDSVVVSNDEEENEIYRTWGNINNNIKNDEEKQQQDIDTTTLRHHHELLYMIGGYEPDKGVHVSGHRAYFLTGPGVLLNLALQNYGIQYLSQYNYTPVYPPFFMNKDVMAKTAQLSDFDEALYHVKGESNDSDKYLIATSEQPISAMQMNEWMENKDLPLKFAGISTNFRKEAGSHGKDAWGIFRVHQFDKIEQFVYCKPDESWDYHENMLVVAEKFYQSLNIPYRVVNIVSGELNNAAAKKYDLEGWFPTLQRYRELVSCSNCTDYQARAMNTRYGYKKKGDRQKEYVHMLNATLCATTRTICCILENNQTDDGIHIPKVLQPYCNGVKFFPFVRPPPLNKQAQKKSNQKKKDKNTNKNQNQNQNQNQKLQ